MNTGYNQDQYELSAHLSAYFDLNLLRQVIRRHLNCTFTIYGNKDKNGVPFKGVVYLAMDTGQWIKINSDERALTSHIYINNESERNHLEQDVIGGYLVPLTRRVAHPSCGSDTDKSIIIHTVAHGPGMAFNSGQSQFNPFKQKEWIPAIGQLVRHIPTGRVGSISLFELADAHNGVIHVVVDYQSPNPNDRGDTHTGNINEFQPFIIPL